jgi:hypothetical protein
MIKDQMTFLNRWKAKRISQELAKLYRDGAITGPHNPEARFYATLLHTFIGTYTGRIEQ